MLKSRNEKAWTVIIRMQGLSCLIQSDGCFGHSNWCVVCTAKHIYNEENPNSSTEMSGWPRYSDLKWWQRIFEFFSGRCLGCKFQDQDHELEGSLIHTNPPPLSRPPTKTK